MLQDGTSACPYVALIFMHEIEVFWPGGSMRAVAAAGVPGAVWKGKGRKEKPHTQLLLLTHRSGERGQVGLGAYIQGLGNHRTVVDFRAFGEQG